MNRERARELLPIIQAFVEGKEIQHRYSMDDDWHDTFNDMPMSHTEEYRIKPEPREFWIKVPSSSGVTYSLTEEEFESGEWKNEDIIKVIEVIE